MPQPIVFVFECPLLQLLYLQFHSQSDYNYERLDSEVEDSPGHYSVYGDEDEDIVYSTALKGQEEENEGITYYTGPRGSRGRGGGKDLCSKFSMLFSLEEKGTEQLA